MRPVRLTLQAFGPFAGREVVDFRAAVESGLFGVYGRTGSGKSTLFSAMSFALFGKPAKEGQEAPTLRSDLAAPETKTEVEFVFDIGPARYVAVRRPGQMRPKKRGGGVTKEDHEAYLFDATGMAPEEIGEARRGRVIAEKKVGAVDAAIVDLLGYGLEQFRQIVLLPQGRFETFLSANTEQRKAILRDLFDVSLYRALMAELKEAARAARTRVETERALCAARLAEEGFESVDALRAGVAEAEAALAARAADERAARLGDEATQAALQAAQALEAQFATAEATAKALTALRGASAEIDALEARMAEAEKARALGDVAGYAERAAREADDAATALQGAVEAAATAEAARVEKAAAAATEAARAGEVEALRREVEALARHRSALEKAAESARLLESARQAERRAATALDEAERALAANLTARRAQEAALKRDGAAAAERHATHQRIAALAEAGAAARRHEAAAKAAERARRDHAARAAEADAASEAAEAARAALDAAEAARAAAHAARLAADLEAGAPCPVCGARDHPSPATGDPAQAGRDAAAREAKAAWESADRAARDAAEARAAAQGARDERVAALNALAPPDAPSAALAAREAEARTALDALGPALDRAAAERAIAALEAETAPLEAARDAAREALATQRGAVTAEEARRAEILDATPEALRAPGALEAAAARASAALATRKAAAEAAQRAEGAARENALARATEREAAETAARKALERREAARAELAARLDAAGLSAAAFAALQPRIAQIEADRTRVDAHRGALALAEDRARIAAEALDGAARPDIEAAETARAAAAAALTEATTLRAQAAQRRDQRAGLRDSLAEILRRLDEEEARTGPLRLLAQMANGENALRHDLETFAIGAMFDRVLEAANLRLGPMTRHQYRLERDLDEAGRGRRGLGARIFDSHTGKARATATLSGGESFIAALSLALGLADVVESASGKVRLDTVFIDEGFGSLDTESGAGTLDQVLQVLNALARGDRAIGLISHVPLVQEAIPNGFHVRKSARGSAVTMREAL